MSKKLLTLAVLVLLTLTGIANAEEATKKLNDWCTVTYPTKVSPNSEAVIKVKFANIKEGLKVRSDMHYFKGPSYGGFLSWWGPAKPAVNDKEYTLKFKVPAKDGMTATKALIFLSPDGNFDKATQKVWTPKIDVE